MPEFIPSWRIPRHRKLAVFAIVTVSVAAGFAGYKYRKSADTELSYERKCANLCHPLASRVQKAYVDPYSPESQRNMPREVLCMCGYSVLGKPLF